MQKLHKFRKYQFLMIRVATLLVSYVFCTKSSIPASYQKSLNFKKVFGQYRMLFYATKLNDVYRITNHHIIKIPSIKPEDLIYFTPGTSKLFREQLKARLIKKHISKLAQQGLKIYAKNENVIYRLTRSGHFTLIKSISPSYERSTYYSTKLNQEKKKIHYYERQKKIKKEQLKQLQYKYDQEKARILEMARLRDQQFVRRQEEDRQWLSQQSPVFYYPPPPPQYYYPPQPYSYYPPPAAFQRSYNPDYYDYPNQEDYYEQKDQYRQRNNYHRQETKYNRNRKINTNEIEEKERKYQFSPINRHGLFIGQFLIAPLYSISKTVKSIFSVRGAWQPEYYFQNKKVSIFARLGSYITKDYSGKRMFANDWQFFLKLLSYRYFISAGGGFQYYTSAGFPSNGMFSGELGFIQRLGPFRSYSIGVSKVGQKFVVFEFKLNLLLEIF